MTVMKEDRRTANIDPDILKFIFEKVSGRRVLRIAKNVLTTNLSFKRRRRGLKTTAKLNVSSVVLLTT